VEKCQGLKSVKKHFEHKPLLLSAECIKCFRDRNGQFQHRNGQFENRNGFLFQITHKKLGWSTEIVSHRSLRFLPKIAGILQPLITTYHSKPLGEVESK
jgi:hypothetical protein